MPGKNYTALFEIAADQYGYVTTRDAKALNIPAKRVAEMAEAGLLERVAHGTYRFLAFPVSKLDQYKEATLWPNGAGGVLSHATALDLHELCDVNSEKIHLTVPQGFRTNSKRPQPKVYRIHHRDLTDADQMLHDGIPIVTPFRAILDGLEVNMRSGLILQAVDTAKRQGLLTPSQLRDVSEAVERNLSQVVI